MDFTGKLHGRSLLDNTGAYHPELPLYSINILPLSLKINTETGRA